MFVEYQEGIKQSNGPLKYEPILINLSMIKLIKEMDAEHCLVSLGTSTHIIKKSYQQIKSDIKSYEYNEYYK